MFYEIEKLEMELQQEEAKKYCQMETCPRFGKPLVNGECRGD